MPFVDLVTSSGPFSFRYSISTPISDSAERIAAGLPCIFFIHSGIVAQEIFELQFSDRCLRQFNLIAVDMRGCGETKGMIGDAPYTPTESAHDIGQIMTKLDFPPCHIFGLSNGCAVALELAVMNPDRVKSLTLCSPSTPTELEEIAAGRMEMFKYWKLADASNDVRNGQETQPVVSEEYLDETIIATNQILYNHMRTDVIQAIAALSLDVGKRIWMGSEENLQQTYKTQIEWFNGRHPIPHELLKIINCPVSIIHCNEDIAYPLECAQNLEATLTGAGVSQVSLYEVPGAHYGNLTNLQGINRILYHTVLSCHPDFVPNMTHTSNASHTKMLTPFTLALEQHGYDPDDDDVELIPNISFPNRLGLSHLSV